MKDFLKGIYTKPHMCKRVIFCFLAVCLMGFCVSWLNLIQWGTDPCSVMNFAIARKLGISFGNWQAIFNCLLFVIVIWKDKSNIGLGTVFNMFLVGYACDVTTLVRGKLFPDLTFGAFWIKVVITIVVMIAFVFGVAVYMAVELGTAPYDALSIIIAKSQDKLSFRTVRIIWDCVVTVIGFLAGGTVGVVTLFMAFTIGPAAALVEKYIGKYIAD